MRRQAALLGALLALSACAAQQIVYMTDSATNLADGAEGGQAYVLGFGKQEGQPPPAQPHRTLLMRSANGTSYRCYIPDDAAAASAAAGTGVSTAAEGSMLAQKSPSQLLEALADHCFYRIEEWWTYELCYGKRLRQYHKEHGRTVSQYLLGTYDPGQPPADDVRLDASELGGAQRYVAQRYADGEACELTGKPREAEVRFTCGAGDDTLLTAIKELASCAYVATVSTPRLCKHPAFQTAPPPAALIQCHPLAPADAAAAAAARPDGHCAAGAVQQPDGTCATPDGAAAAAAAAGGGGDGGGGVPAGAATAVGDNASAAAPDDGGEEDHALLQSLVEGEGGEAYYEYSDDTLDDGPLAGGDPRPDDA